jgi:hypothetical protein
MRMTAAFAGAAACLAVLTLPAGLARAEQSAQEQINDLQRQGYLVQIDKIGTGPMSKCIVTSVRNPQTLTQWVPYVGPGLGDRGTFLIPVVTSRTISVSLDCSRQ